MQHVLFEINTFPNICSILFVLHLYDNLTAGNLWDFFQSSQLWDTYLKSDSYRSDILHFSPIASFSKTLILGSEFSSIIRWIVDFETPDITASWRTDRFFSFIILYNNIFMLLLCLIIKKLYLEINGITAYAFIYWFEGFTPS